MEAAIEPDTSMSHGLIQPDPKALKHLDLSHNSFDTSVADSLFTYLRSSARALRTLVLRIDEQDGEGLSDSNCRDIFSLLCGNGSCLFGKFLERLDLTGHGLRSTGCEALVAALSIRKTLKMVQLRSNKIGDRGGTLIADFLERTYGGGQDHQNGLGSCRQKMASEGDLLVIDLSGNQISATVRKRIEAAQKGCCKRPVRVHL